MRKKTLKYELKIGRTKNYFKIGRNNYHNIIIHTPVWIHTHQKVMSGELAKGFE